MMKRMLLILMVLLMAAPAAAEGTLLEQYAVKLAQEMPLLIGNEAYVSMYTGGAFLGGDLLTRLADCTWQEPSGDVYLSLDMELLGAMSETDGAEGLPDLAQLPPENYSTLVSYAVAMPATAEEMIVSNVAYASVTYIDPAQPDGTVIFIRFFADGLPLMYCCTARDAAVCLTVKALAGRGMAADVNALKEMLARGMPFIVASEAPAMLPVGFPFVAGGETLAQRAVSLAQEAGRRMADPVHRRVYGLNGEAEALVTAWSAGDYGVPRLIVQPQLDARTHGLQVWGVESVQVLAEEDSPAAHRLEGMICASWFGALASRYGGAAVTAALNTTAAKTFWADPAQPDGHGAYILCFEDGHMMLAKWQAQNGVVFMSAEYLHVPELATCCSATEMALWLTSHMAPVVCSEVPLN